MAHKAASCSALTTTFMTLPPSATSASPPASPRVSTRAAARHALHGPRPLPLSSAHSSSSPPTAPMTPDTNLKDKFAGLSPINLRVEPGANTQGCDLFYTTDEQDPLGDTGTPYTDGKIGFKWAEQPSPVVFKCVHSRVPFITPTKPCSRRGPSRIALAAAAAAPAAAAATAAAAAAADGEEGARGGSAAGGGVV